MFVLRILRTVNSPLKFHVIKNCYQVYLHTAEKKLVFIQLEQTYVLEAGQDTVQSFVSATLVRS